MTDFFFYIHLTDFLLLELCRQHDIPLIGDYQFRNKIRNDVLTIHF